MPFKGKKTRAVTVFNAKGEFRLTFRYVIVLNNECNTSFSAVRGQFSYGVETDYAINQRQLVSRHELFHLINAQSCHVLFKILTYRLIIYFRGKLGRYPPWPGKVRSFHELNSCCFCEGSCWLLHIEVEVTGCVKNLAS